MKKKITPVIICVLLVMCLFPTVSLAATETIDLAGYASGDTITIHSGDIATITDSAPAERTNIRIVCEAGVSVTLSGVNINNSATGGACPLYFMGGDNTLTLAAGTTNTLTAGANEAAVRAEGSTKLTIDGTGTLFANGGDCGAGIGARRESDGGDITIKSGTINSKGGVVATGIGGGYSGGWDKITINGGNVTATGRDNAAGIGGGLFSTGGVINITGGNVTATSTSGSGVSGAGIGSGTSGSGCIINISGGNVTASSTNGGAGIGCGYSGAGSTVQITGGVISATGSSGGYDIGKGGGSSGAPGTLSMDGYASITLNSIGTNSAVTMGNCYITGAGAGSLAGVYIDGEKFGDVANEIVIDVGGTYGMTSGFGYDAATGTFILPMANYRYFLVGSTTSRRVIVAFGITTDVILFGTSIQPGSGSALNLTGSNVDLELCGTSTLKSANDAGLLVQAASAVSISGDGTLNAAGGDTYSGIGGGGSVTINSGKINAVGGIWAAGIGGFHNQPGTCGIINIKGGNVTANGGGAGAGIGTGLFSSGTGEIHISGGNVTATGGTENIDNNGGAGLGGGAFAQSASVEITGGNVKAYGGDSAAGIGGGQSGSGHTIEITGGTVYAEGKDGGAGIGGGLSNTMDNAGNAGNITISGGKVYADGLEQAEDIGRGFNGTSGTLSISGSAAVFAANDRFLSPVSAATHIHTSYDTDTESSYGVAIPSGWVPRFGSYLRPCKLSYNAGGGSGTVPAEVTQLYNTTTAISDGSGLSRQYYKYGGWNTKADGTGTAYAAGSTFTFSADTTLYAQWAGNTYTVEYNANGGAGTTASSSHAYDAAKALTANGFTRTGYTFAGWAESASGAALYTDGQSVKNLASADGAKVTLYAKWTANSYTVEYNANGGAGTTASSSHAYDAAKALAANGFTRAGYTFAGWAESAGGAAVYTDGQSVKNLASADGAKVTLYAKWTAVPQLTSSAADGKIYAGGRITLTPNIPGGTWSFDASMLLRDGNIFTALKTGVVRVTYTVEGQSTYYDVTAQAAQLPKTGQDGTLIWVLAAAGAAVLAAAVLAVKYKRAK